MQVALFVVNTGIGVGAGAGMFIVAECNVGDAGGVVAVVRGTLFLPQSSGGNLPSGVAAISRITGDRRRHWLIQ